ERLASHATSTGLLTEETIALYNNILDRRTTLKGQIQKTQIVPTQETQNKLRQLNTPVLQKPISLADLLRRNEVQSIHLREFGADVPDDENKWEAVEIEIKYEGYIRRQNELIEQTSKLERMRLPDDLNFGEVYGLSREEVEKLTK